VHRTALLLAVALACDGTKPGTPAPGTAGGSGSAASETAGQDQAMTCEALPFAESTAVPEASGAAWLSIGGKLALVVIGDSGNHGAYAIVDPETGDTLEHGKLPLGGDGEDLEGIAARGGKLYVITSPGWMRVYQRSTSAEAFELVDGPYALGPIDLEGKSGGLGDKPPKGSGMVCDANRVNCGRNYEGLCLAPGPVSGRCIGFAAAKADGHLYCVIDVDGRLAVEYPNAIRVARPGVIGDCAFAEDGTLHAGSNLFDLGNVYRIDGWEHPATATVTTLGALGVGFPETLAVRGDVFYRMSDTGGAPSLMRKFRCR
jgi:hypothetical protein